MLTDAEIMAQVLAAFIEEQAEHRQSAGELLLQLERAPDHPQRQSLLDQLFREAHSLKGGARAAGQTEVELIAHRVEDLFSAVRRGTLELSADLCDPIYAALDAIGVLVQQVSAGQPADLAPYADLIDALARPLGAQPEPPADGPAPDPLGLEPTLEPFVAPTAAEAGPDPFSAPAQPTPAAAQPPERPRGRRRGRALSQHDLVVAASGMGAAGDSSNGHGGEVHALAAMPAPDPDLLDEIAPAGETAPALNGSTIRISTASLDTLMNETGELMTCSLRNHQHTRDILQLADLTERWRRIWRQTRPIYARLQERMPSIRPAVHYLGDRAELATPETENLVDRETTVLLGALREANDMISELERRLGEYGRQIAEDSTRLAAVVDRMHGHVRRARMLPLATIFGQIRLQAREMARTAGKSVALHFDDGGAEADRQVLERLREVATHLLRNAIDHGIEAPELRAARGKPAEGRITLRARANGDRLLLTMEDDGAGLDLEAIRQRAISNNWLSEHDTHTVSDAELSNLIFQPGFSTRQVVSKLSGRGVGLDIVRSHVGRMHGHVDVSSTPGAGCTFTISVPLSLTSSRGLLLQAGPSRYVLPIDAVQRIVQVALHDIQMLEGRAALLLDGRPVALVSLADILSGGGGTSTPSSAVRLALLLGSGDRQVACLVDAVLSEQELVTHRLPPPLQQVRFVASATILTDGSVVPILDVVDLLGAALGVRQTISLAVEQAAPRRVPRVLVVDDSITTRTLEKNILESAGYQVCLATDGAEALQTLNQMLDDGGCDLLLSDIDMPRLNGFDLTIQVRATSRIQHLPIVLVTSLDTVADRERGIAAGADAYIVKRNFEQRALLETISQLI